MPSFRVTMTIGALAPGTRPDRVLPIATDAASTLATAEASSVNVVRGEPRLTVRFTAEDAELAEQVAQHVVHVTSSVAEVPAWTLTRRSGDRWYTLKRA
jgi:hypothetical protein